ncbi:hypothetical protein G9A89_019673 [Geosiphon pyriformis]|nr:hypothetical protein G9A89_019673 [Geosiphon pyriformis]
MTYLGKFNKLLRRICQLETNEYYSNAQILDQFIARLKDKLIKKVCPHAPEDLATTIQQVKNYKMAMEELKTISLTNSNNSSHSNHNNHKDTNPYNDAIKTTLDHHLITKSKIVIIVEFQDTENTIVENCNEINNKEIINIIPNYNNILSTTTSSIFTKYQQPFTSQYQVPARRLIQHNQFIPQNRFSTNNNRFNSNNQLTTQNSNQYRPIHYHTQPSYLTIPEESNFQQTALFKNEAAAPRQNPSNNTISPARIAQNANLSDIFLFEFEANESPSLLSNVAVNKQKAITAMYIEAKVEGKPICLILDSKSAHLSINATASMNYGMKKTPVEEIDNFLFTIDRITIPVKVLVIDAPQYQALFRNNWLLKTNANLDWETQELKISYQEQHTIVSAICRTFNKRSEKAPVLEFEEEKEMPLTETYMALGLTSNWAEETEQEIFEELRK